MESRDREVKVGRVHTKVSVYGGWGSLPLSLGLEEDTGGALTERYLASMNPWSRPSTGDLNLGAHKVFDGHVGRCSGRGSLVLPGQGGPYLDCILKGPPGELRPHDSRSRTEICKSKTWPRAAMVAACKNEGTT